METFHSGVPAPFCESASVSAVTASHPFGGGNAGGNQKQETTLEIMQNCLRLLEERSAGRMSSHDVMDGVARASAVWGKMDGAPHEANIDNCKRSLQKCARAITQLWGDVVAEEQRREVGRKALV